MREKLGCSAQKSKYLKALLLQIGSMTLTTIGEWLDMPEFRKEASKKENSILQVVLTKTRSIFLIFLLALAEVDQVNLRLA